MIENQVKVTWHMPECHVSFMINVWTKYGKSMLYSNRGNDLIIKTWSKFNKMIENQVKVTWHMPECHVSFMINVWTKYGKSMLYSNRGNDLIIKTWK